MKKAKGILGVILDVDGTLVDTNDLHAESWVRALSKFGKEVSFEKVRPLIGMGGDKLLPAVAGISSESELGKEISEYRSDLFKREYLPKARAFPKARSLVETLKNLGIKIVVGSSAKKDELEPLLELAGVCDLIKGETSADDAENSKPDPDIIQAALKELKLPSEKVLMLGDTPYDIEAAKKAHVGTVALRSGGWEDKALSGALAIYRDPEDLVTHIEESPFV